jgi:hypothetical protein
MANTSPCHALAVVDRRIAHRRFPTGLSAGTCAIDAAKAQQRALAPAHDLQRGPFEVGSSSLAAEGRSKAPNLRLCYDDDAPRETHYSLR